MNDVVTSIITTVIAQGAIFGFLSFAGKKAADFAASKMLKEAEVKLKQKADEELERLKMELGLSTESYKAQLRKSELVFEKEYEASSALYNVWREMLPEATHIDAEWYEDALPTIIDMADVTKEKLNKFLDAHGPALTPDELQTVELCVLISNDIAIAEKDPEYSELQKPAQHLFDQLQKVTRGLHERVRSQSAL